MVVNKTSMLSLPLLMAGGTLISTAAIGLLIWIIKKREKVYTKVGKVKRLFLYPVKSLKGIEVPELQSTQLGVEVNGIIDRSYMLISDKRVLVSQRQEPTLTLLAISILDHTIVITDPDGKTLKLNSGSEKVSTEEEVDCRVHEDFLETVDCGDVAAQFFQDFLDRKDVRLVRYVPGLHTRKFCGKEPIFDSIKKEKPPILTGISRTAIAEKVVFQDLSPLNILNQSSVDDLNTRMENHKVAVYNFRPNVVVADAPPYAEDNWKHIQFSSGAVVDNLLPCGRCVMTTNDPETGIKTNKEPLVTLRKFRMPKDPKLSQFLGHSPCFGLNCFLRKGGTIAIDDEISAVVEDGYIQY